MQKCQNSKKVGDFNNKSDDSGYSNNPFISWEKISEKDSSNDSA